MLHLHDNRTSATATPKGRMIGDVGALAAGEWAMDF